MIAMCRGGADERARPVFLGAEWDVFKTYCSPEHRTIEPF